MTFSTRIAVIASTAVLIAASAVAKDIDLIKGKMTYEDYGDNLKVTKQAFSVKNNSSGTIAAVVECDFWQKEKLLDSGRSITVGNVKSGQNGFDVLVGNGHADRTECRIDESTTKVDRRGNDKLERRQRH